MPAHPTLFAGTARMLATAALQCSTFAPPMSGPARPVLGLVGNDPLGVVRTNLRGER